MDPDDSYEDEEYRRRKMEDWLEWQHWANRVCFEPSPAEQIEADRRYFENLVSIVYGQDGGLDFDTVRGRDVESDERIVSNHSAVESTVAFSSNSCEIVSPMTARAHARIAVLDERISALRIEWSHARSDVAALEKRLSEKPDSQAISERLAAATLWMDHVARQGKQLACDKSRLLEAAPPQSQAEDG